MKKSLIPTALFLLVLFVSAQAENLENRIGFSIHGYTDDASERIYSGKLDVFRKLTERFGIGVNAGVDAISGATRTAATDAVSGATQAASGAARPAAGADDDDDDDGDTSDDDSNVRFYPSARLVYDDGENNAVLGGYFSFEDDYTGRTAFVNYTRQLNMQNTAVSVGFSQSFDTWDVAGLDDHDRRQRQVTLSVTQILGRKTQVQAGYDLIHSEGHLGNPNRFINFTEGQVLERLPSDRQGHAGTLRLVQSLAEPTSLHLAYRYYDDDWGISSHTATVELYQDLSGTFTLGGRYRYYTQSEADFIKPVGGYAFSDPYIGIDYKYTDFHAHTVGLMAIYSPGAGYGDSAWGRTRIKLGVDAYQTSPNDYIRAWYGQSRLTAFFGSLGVEYFY